MRKVIKIGDLVSGMVLARCVVDSQGKIVLSEGATVTDRIIHRLQAWDIDEVCIVCSAGNSEGAN